MAYDSSGPGRRDGACRYVCSVGVAGMSYQGPVYLSGWFQFSETVICAWRRTTEAGVLRKACSAGFSSESCSVDGLPDLRIAEDRVRKLVALLEGDAVELDSGVAPEMAVFLRSVIASLGASK